MVLLILIPFLNGYFIGGIHHFQTYPDSLAIENGDFPIENGDFPIENGDFLIENHIQRSSHQVTVLSGTGELCRHIQATAKKGKADSQLPARLNFPSPQKGWVLIRVGILSIYTCHA